MCGVECSIGSVWLFAFFFAVGQLRVRARSYRLNHTAQMIDPMEALSLSERRAQYRQNSKPCVRRILFLVTAPGVFPPAIPLSWVAAVVDDLLNGVGIRSC